MDAVPKLNVAVGSAAAVLLADDDAAGPGVPVHDASPKITRTAVNSIPSRRILLLATLVPSSRSEVLWPASARPHSSLVERPRCRFRRVAGMVPVCLRKEHPRSE